MTKLILKIIFILSIPLSALTGCNKGEIYKRLAQVDSLLIKNMPDSAMKMLEQIPEKNISDKEARAYYNLLTIQTRYRLYQPITSDSLINISIDYYQNGDKEKLARSYYYKGATLLEIGRAKEAVVCLKEAEALAYKINDNALNNKIWGSLCQINEEAGEFGLALKYARKNMNLSIKCKNNYWLAYAFNDMAFCYGDLWKQDCAMYYIDKCIPLLKDVPMKERTILLNNIGFYYINTDTTKALKYLKEAYKIKPIPSTLDNIACIYARNGNIEKADELWKEALKTANANSKINIMEDMIKYYDKFGLHEEASKISSELIKVRKNREKKHSEENVKDLQTGIDRKAERKKNETTTLYILYMAVSILLISTIISIYHRHKINKIKGNYDEAQNQIQTYKDTIKDKENIENKYKSKIEEQEEFINLLQDNKLESINKGKSLYTYVMEGGATVTW